MVGRVAAIWASMDKMIDTYMVRFCKWSSSKVIKTVGPTFWDAYQHIYFELMYNMKLALLYIVKHTQKKYSNPPMAEILKSSSNPSNSDTFCGWRNFRFDLVKHYIIHGSGANSQIPH